MVIEVNSIVQQRSFDVLCSCLYVYAYVSVCVCVYVCVCVCARVCRTIYLSLIDSDGYRVQTRGRMEKWNLPSHNIG